jgi:ABC-type multidrug transport system fused ATPase/permease subunit
LTAPTVIGPFDGDRSRTLKAELVAPGAVGYWCTGGQSDTYTCGLSEQETREYIDRVALGPAQEVLNRFLQEHIEQPLQAAMSRHSLGELLRLGERHFGTQIRQMLRPYLGPVADEVFNRATAEQLAQLIDNALGPEAQVIVTTLVRRLSSMIINELRVRLRNVLADAVRETLLALCVGAPAVSIVQLLDQLEQTLRQRARQLIPVVVTAVAAQLASMMLAELQAVLTQMAQAIGRALSALGEVLAVIGEGILRALAAIAIALVIVGALVLFVLALIALFDPAPGDEVALAAAGIFLLGLIPALGRYVATGNTAKQPEGT